jgi:ABC-2 type transport system permease protein
VSRTLAIARFELRNMVHDALWYVPGLVMPILLMGLVRPLYDNAAGVFGEGQRGDGSLQAVPGMAVMFGFFGVGLVTVSFLREHGEGTWQRLRATPATPSEVTVGKTLPYLGVALVHQAVMFGAGMLLFGLHVAGSLVALAVVAFALSAVIVTLGVLIVTVASSTERVNVLQTVGSLVFAGLGGALVPLSLLPGWVQAVGPAVPSYWAMRGFRAVLIDGQGIAGVAAPVAVLLAFTVGLLALTARRFRFEDVKPYWR